VAALLLSGGLVIGAATTWILGVMSDRDSEWLDERFSQVEDHLSVADWESAYALVGEIQSRFPDDPELDGLWTRVSWAVTIPSEPPGARVYRRPYGQNLEWEFLGRTPLDIRFPLGLSEIRLELEGYETVHRTLGGGHLNWERLGSGPKDSLLVGPEIYRLDAEGTIPPGMVRISGWNQSNEGADIEVQDYFLGRYEVTNEEFKRFVDARGYQQPNYWDPVVVNGRKLAWEDAMDLFRDRTGRYGPSTWQAGDYPAEAGGMPVTGVSWYEAAAYARFVGRDLPTAHHWQNALATSTFPWLVPLSNFSGDGPRRVMDSRALSYSGTYDLAGNVREWTRNAIGDEKIILGGSWNDPYYVAGSVDASAPPLDRSEGNGLRLAVTADTQPVADILQSPFNSRSTAASTKSRLPVSDEIYAAYSRVFDYDRTPLNALVEEVSETRTWIRERILFDAVYGKEQVVLYLYLPTTGGPPFQTVVYWPGWDTFRLNDVDHYFARQVDFIVKSGRAVAFPVLRGSFERRVDNHRVRPAFDTIAWRDNAIHALKDIRRTIDFLESRRDVDSSALAYFGYSWGGVNAPMTLAQEDRFKVAVIDIGMMPDMSSIPEVDPLNSLPRIRVPSLMFSGEFDPIVSRTDSEKFFELIGVASNRKKHVTALGGHYIPRDLLIRETLDWLDEYLGSPRT
jgi:dienelactone hydrolase